MFLIKSNQRPIFCRRCGDQLSSDEILHFTGGLCVLCEHMHNEALEIHTRQLDRRSRQNKRPTPLFVV